MHQLVLIAVAPGADALSHRHRLVHVVRRHQEMYRIHVRARAYVECIGIQRGETTTRGKATEIGIQSV